MLEQLDVILRHVTLQGASHFQWNTLDITYHPPFVERAWTPFELEGTPYRFCIHRIHPCTEVEALYHPHPWPSAVQLLEGSYRHHVGIKLALGPVRTLTTQRLSPGGAYEMADPVAYHRVVPSEPSLSVMLMGPLYPHSLPISKPPKQPPLSQGKLLRLLDDFTLSRLP